MAWVTDPIFLDFARRAGMTPENAVKLRQWQASLAAQGKPATLHQLAVQAKLLTPAQEASLSAAASSGPLPALTPAPVVPPAPIVRPSAITDRLPAATPGPPRPPSGKLPPPAAVTAPPPAARASGETDRLPPVGFEPVRDSDRVPRPETQASGAKKVSDRVRRAGSDRSRLGRSRSDRLKNSHVSDETSIDLGVGGKRSSAALALVGIGSIVLALVVLVGAVVYDPKKPERPAEPAPIPTPTPTPVTPPPVPPSPSTIQPPQLLPVTPDPTPTPATEESPLERAERVIARSKRLDFTEARPLLEKLLEDPEVAGHPIAADVVRQELAARAQAAETPASTTPEEEPGDDKTAGDKPEETRPTEPEPAVVAKDVGGTLGAVRARLRALDLAAAREALEALAPVAQDAERAELDARAAWLDSAGARLPPGLTITTTGPSMKVVVAKASAKGVEAQDGTLVPWPRVTLASRRTLLVAADKATDAEPRGAALVLYDHGLWRRGDARVKSAVDAGAPASVAIAARARGLEGELRFRAGEWLTSDEEQVASKDLVVLDGQKVTRDDARRQIEKLRKDRKPSKKGVQEKLRARAEELRRDYGVQDIQTIVASGDPAKRADIVVISDGYAAEDVPRFERIAAGIAKAVLTIEPFKNYARYVNIHRITVLEPRSGVTGSTRIGSSVRPGGILTCNHGVARQYAALAPDADLVIVNSNIRGVRSTGSVGARPGVITQDSDADFNDVVLHEIGHAFADLDDEYVDPTVAPSHPDYGADRERWHVNTTREPQVARAKWHYWRLPPLVPEEQRVDCFEGAYYRAKGYYRPSRTCRMESRGGCKFYCPPCLERLEKSFFERIEPIDDFQPRTPEVVVWKDELAHFEATAIAIETAGERFGSFSARWFIDGKVTGSKSAGIKTELDAAPGSLSPGDHTVALRVVLSDTRVRRDDGLLSSARAWTVRVLDRARPKLVAPDRCDVSRGELVAFDVTVEPASATLSLQGPAGAELETTSPGKARVVWAPPRSARGARHFLLSTGEGQRRVERPVLVSIQDDAHNVPPVLADPGTVHAVRGQPFELRLEATDPDGDALVFSADKKKLPPGATLDAATGVFQWTPSFTTPFLPEHDVTVHVTDGKKDDELVFKLKVQNRTVTSPVSGFDLLLAARAPSPRLRWAAQDALAKSDLALDVVLLELTRFLRDPEPQLSARALDALKRLPASTDGTRRGLLAIDFSDHLWEFTDKPDVRAFVRENLLKGEPGDDAAVRKATEKLKKELAAIDAYNKERGVR